MKREKNSKKKKKLVKRKRNQARITLSSLNERNN